MTQKQRVLHHLRHRGSLTTLVAFRRYQIFRLSERIRELERDGCYIHHFPVSRGGKRYMGYSLIGAR